MSASYVMRSSGLPPSVPLRAKPGATNAAHPDPMSCPSKEREVDFPAEGGTSSCGTQPTLEYVLVMPISSAAEEERSLKLYRERQQLRREKQRWRLQQQADMAELRAREDTVARREQALELAYQSLDDTAKRT